MDSSRAYLNGIDTARYNGEIPEEVTAIITVTLVGVEDQRIMDEEEQDIFQDSLVQFFDNELLSENEGNPSIRVKVIIVQSQLLVEKDKAVVESNQRRVEESDANILEVTVSVDGVYLPPPSITFDEVLVETLDEGGDDDFIEILNKNSDSLNETYFKPVTSAVSSNDDENEDDEGIRDIIIGVVFGAAGLVSLLAFIQFMRKSVRRSRAAKKEKRLKEEFRNRPDNNNQGYIILE